MLRIGEGYDVHALAPGKQLRLGCVEVPALAGAVGHSDGDALVHAVCDAILGALAQGDIGSHFPPGDPQWRGARSSVFLQRVAGMLAERGGRIVNIDATVVIEAPRLAPHVGRMRAAMAAVLGCEESLISVKAKTAEGFGAVGRGEAIEARAVVLIELAEPSDPPAC